MRIFVLTDLYPPHYCGGYELRCREQVEELTKRDHEVFVLTSTWGLGESKVEGKVYRLLHVNPTLGPFSKKDPLHLLKRYAQLKLAFASRRDYRIARDILAALRPDVAYIWNMGNVPVSSVLAVQDQGIPTVFNLGGPWLAELKTELCLEPNPLKRRYRAAIVGLEDFGRIDLRHILVNSRALMQSYLELDFPEQNITVIPRGIPSHLIMDANDLSSLPSADKDGVKLIFTGRLVPEKGPDVAIEAVAHMVRELGISDIRLDIIGTGPDENVRQLHDMVIDLGLDKRVTFLGRLEHQELLVRYTEYDVLLFTSRWMEPFSVTLLEAMARGLPVIATNVGCVPEIISAGENGLLVPPDEPRAIADAVRTLLQDPALAQKIRYAGLNTVRERYAHERIVDQSEEYLQMVLQQAHPGFDV